jgi:hypothetical protein
MRYMEPRSLDGRLIPAGDHGPLKRGRLDPDGGLERASGGMNSHAGSPCPEQKLGVEEPAAIEHGRDETARDVCAQRLEAGADRDLAVARDHWSDQLGGRPDMSMSRPASALATTLASLVIHAAARARPRPTSFR